MSNPKKIYFPYVHFVIKKPRQHLNRYKLYIYIKDKINIKIIHKNKLQISKLKIKRTIPPIKSN